MNDTTEPMTAREHRVEAERKLEGANEMRQIAEDTAGAKNYPAHEAAKWGADHLTALAQVHATLAVAAAQYEAAEFLADSLPTYEGDLSVRVHGQVSAR